jgi:hypothetical protein
MGAECPAAPASRRLGIRSLRPVIRGEDAAAGEGGRVDEGERATEELVDAIVSTIVPET